MSKSPTKNAPAKRPTQEPQHAQVDPIQGQPKRSVHQVAVHQQSWQGPLPSPDMLAKFDHVVPGSAERIIRMAEQEGEHSREVQMRAVRATVRIQHIGQVMAFVLCLGALYCAYQLAMNGHDWVAATLVASGLVGLAAVFHNIGKQGQQ